MEEADEYDDEIGYEDDDFADEYDDESGDDEYDDEYGYDDDESFDPDFDDEDGYEEDGDDIYMEDRSSKKSQRAKGGKKEKDSDDYDINFIDL